METTFMLGQCGWHLDTLVSNAKIMTGIKCIFNLSGTLKCDIKMFIFVSFDQPYCRHGLFINLYFTGWKARWDQDLVLTWNEVSSTRHLNRLQCKTEVWTERGFYNICNWNWDVLEWQWFFKSLSSRINPFKSKILNYSKVGLKKSI